MMNKYRYVDYEGDGVDSYQCLKCQQFFAILSNISEWKFCPYCGTQWEGQLDCPSRSEQRDKKLSKVGWKYFPPLIRPHFVIQKLDSFSNKWEREFSSSYLTKEEALKAFKNLIKDTKKYCGYCDKAYRIAYSPGGVEKHEDLKYISTKIVFENPYFSA